jgi:hypothetical protein
MLRTQMADKLPARRISVHRSGTCLQRARSARATERDIVPASVHEVLRSSGRPLDAATRSFFEPRFGQDFSAVRVHTDTQAAESTRSVDALAYTVGHDIMFDTGQYQPGSQAGQQLLVHELTHVVQQSGQQASTLQTLSVGPANDGYEREAEAMARGIPGDTFSLKTPTLQRQTDALSDQTPTDEAEPLGPADNPAQNLDDSTCVQPSAVHLVSSHQVQFPNHLTGGGSAGICAVMQALPIVTNLCPRSIHEEVTLASGATCPNSLFVGGLCSGSSTFTPGLNQSATCSSLTIPATGFTDLHAAKVRGVSVLHDSTRNPSGLARCGYICNQRYYTQAGTTQRTIGRFQIRYEVVSATRDGGPVTDVTAIKTAVP